MKISKISVSYDRKFNQGNYNSIRLEATCWADLEPLEDPDLAVQALWAYCREAVRGEYSRLKDQVGPNEQAASKAQLPEPGDGILPDRG